MNTLQNRSPVPCLPTTLLICPGYSEYTCLTRGKDLIFDKLGFLDLSCFSIQFWSTVFRATGDSILANNIEDRGARDADKV